LDERAELSTEKKRKKSFLTKVKNQDFKIKESAQSVPHSNF